MDFFGGGGGYSLDTGATSGAQGGSNTGGGFSVGAFSPNAGIDPKWLIGGAVAVALIAGLVLIKR